MDQAIEPHQAKARALPAAQRASAALLTNCASRTGRVRTCFQGRPASRSGDIKTMWRSVTKQAGLTGVRVHDLRHTHAALLASGGASLP